MARTLIWVCVHCDLDLGDMTLGQGHDTPLGHGQQLCEIFSRSNMALRSYGLDTMCIVTFTLEIWPWVKVMTYPWVMDNNCVKYYPDQTSGNGVMARTRSEQMDRRTDGKTGWFLYTPHTLFAGGILNMKLYIENCSNYRVRTKVLTKFRCDLDLWTPKCIGIVLLPSGIYVWNMKAVRWKLLKLSCQNQIVDKVRLWPWPFDPKMYVWNTDVPSGNKVKIWQSPTFWPYPTPRGMGCQWSVMNP